MFPQSGAQYKSPTSAARAGATPVYLNGRPIGAVTAGVFCKSLCASKHFLKQPQAICFDTATLRDAVAAGAVAVEVLDRETGRVFSAPMATLRAHFFRVMRGFGDQVGLGLDHWRVNGEPAVAERRAGATNQEVKALQPGLFDLGDGSGGGDL